MDLKSKHSYQTQSFLWLLGFSWLLIVCFVGFQYHREKELRTELLDSQLQIINAQLEEALSNARTPHDFFDAHSDFFEGLRITLIDLDGTVASLLQSQMKTELKLIGLKRKHSTWQPVMEYVCILLQIRNRITRLLQFIQ